MTLRNMSTKLTIGRIALQQTAPREIRVVKATANDTATSDYLERHQLSLLKLLCERYPARAKEYAEKYLLTAGVSL